jgi:cytochrome c553
MKKGIVVGASAIVAVLLAIFGPDLLDLYRLENFITSSDQAYRANGGPWPHVTDECFGCHGVKGNSQSQGYPSLAGQPSLYVAAQLHNFANGQRANPTMGPLAMTMSEAEISGLANYFSKQTVSENRFFEPDSRLRQNGHDLVAKGGCAACHGDRLMGSDQFPRLAGQGHDYLVAQLDAFAAGRRSDPTGTMQKLAAAATPAERKAMATYLAALDTETKP